MLLTIKVVLFRFWLFYNIQGNDGRVHSFFFKFLQLFFFKYFICITYYMMYLCLIICLILYETRKLSIHFLIHFDVHYPIFISSLKTKRFRDRDFLFPRWPRMRWRKDGHRKRC